MEYKDIDYIDLQKYEREAQKLRAEAMRYGAIQFAAWVKSFFTSAAKTDGATA